MCYACKSEKLVNNLKHFSPSLSPSLSRACARSKNSALSCSAWMQCGRTWRKYEGHNFIFLHYVLLTADGIYTQELRKSKTAIKMPQPQPGPKNHKCMSLA